ncbi:MAG: hypothetical protein MUC42_06105 [Bryobacter sp.]|nr:hypothetical protein [Bryobacter sp.]
MEQTTVDRAASAEQYYVWRVDGKPVSIHLHFDVVDKMSAEVMRGFGAVPRRGAEVGGLLLGHVEVGENLVVRIDDFEAVSIEHKRGPSFLLSDTDQQRFAEAVEKWRGQTGKRLSLVGFYRSHTRDGLGLAPEDVDLFGEYFGEPSQVILLIRPFATKVSRAGFFFPEDGRIRSEASYLEFPFRRRDLGGGSPPEPERPAHAGLESAPVAAALSAAVAAPAIIEPPASLAGVEVEAVKPGAVARLKNSWVWLPLSFIFLFLGVILGFNFALSAKRPILLAPTQEAYVLNLTAERENSSLHVKWDRMSPAVRASSRGVLHISESGYSKSVDLDSAQLKNGSVIYHNVSPQVVFRLEVFPVDRSSLSETVRYQGDQSALK